MKYLRFALFGAGFGARFFNRTRSKAEQLAREFGVPSVYDDAEELLNREITFATLTAILST